LESIAKVGSGAISPATTVGSLLLVMDTQAAVHPRREWLERAGYQVSPACTLKDVEEACVSGKFDIVLVADAVDLRMKKAVGLTVRQYFPDAPILQMGNSHPDIEGNCFVTGDSREDILRSLTQILRHDDIRPAAL
jgi:CheY-like chemotaxis protein